MYKNKIAALTLAATMLTSASGCGNSNKLKYQYNEETKQYEYLGEITYDELRKVYVVELKDASDTSKIVIGKKQTTVAGDDKESVYYKLGTDVYFLEIGNYSIYEGCKKVGTKTTIECSGGTYKSESRITDYMLYYDIPIKDKYSGKEILDLTQKIYSDYKLFETDENKVLKKINNN